MTPKYKTPFRNGFSLVEFLVAAFIMAIGILGLTMLMTINVRQTSNSRWRSTATYIAQGILQQAQIEGQSSYFAKINSIATTTTPVFTATPGQAIAETAIGGFNVDGIRVTNADGSPVSNLSILVPDANKRTPVFTASWVRRAYSGADVPLSNSHSQEFLANIAWTEDSQAKSLTMSRIIRY